MISKKNIKFLNKKESALILVIVTPLFIILAIPAAVIFTFRGIFRLLKPRKVEEQTSRREPYF